jgi:uncharacterized protein YjbJ (UPF0337 family)
MSSLIIERGSPGDEVSFESFASYVGNGLAGRKGILTGNRVVTRALPGHCAQALKLPQHRKEQAMNWDRVEGNWKQITGKVKEQWGKLTEDDLTVINGKQDQLVGRIQERYGVAKDEAERQVSSWINRM